LNENYTRTDAAETTRRLLAESEAGKAEADVFDGAAGPSHALTDKKLVMSYTPEAAQRLPSQYADKAGLWVATNLYVYTLGVNTDLVPRGTEPKYFSDLLEPKWKAKMAWSGRASTSSAPGFIGAVLDEMGPDKAMDYLRALAKQNIAPVAVSARQLLDQTIAGEYSIAIEIISNHATISKAKGAPCDFALDHPPGVRPRQR